MPDPDVSDATTPTAPVRLDYALPPRAAFEWRPWRRLAGVMAVLYALAAAAAVLAHYTIGEMVSGLLLMVTAAAALVTLAVSFFHRRTALVVTLLVALFIVPEQAWLGVKWLRQSREAARVVEYVEAHRKANGAYPPNLAGYRPRDAGAFATFNYTPDPAAAGFTLWYSIGSENTAHSYTPAGGWFYYPD
jgi:hypothetical protein